MKEECYENRRTKEEEDFKLGLVMLDIVKDKIKRNMFIVIEPIRICKE